MGLKNYLIEGVSCVGKTTVCEQLIKRGYQGIHGDRELAYQGDPLTGVAMNTSDHTHHIWDVDKVKHLISDNSNQATFFCGGSRNFNQFIHLFDLVFVLDIDRHTLIDRLKLRPADEWGGQPSQKDFILDLHSTKEDLPKDAIVVNSAGSIENIVNEILSKTGLSLTAT
ncbi:MAG: nucleoside kinase [Candidatus Cloacimonetes bacterium]|nr:nucleoside kinase [Candidatus Cloacimonadota bacterium]